MAYYTVITNKIYLMTWKNTLHSLSSGKKRIQNDIHSMLQICGKNIKEQNIYMQRKKVKNIHQYVWNWLRLGGMVFLYLLYFPLFSEFFTMKLFVLYLPKKCI